MPSIIASLCALSFVYPQQPFNCANASDHAFSETHELIHPTARIHYCQNISK